MIKEKLKWDGKGRLCSTKEKFKNGQKICYNLSMGGSLFCEKCHKDNNWLSKYTSPELIFIWEHKIYKIPKPKIPEFKPRELQNANSADRNIKEEWFEDKKLLKKGFEKLNSEWEKYQPKNVTRKEILEFEKYMTGNDDVEEDQLSEYEKCLIVWWSMTDRAGNGWDINKNPLYVTVQNWTNLEQMLRMWDDCIKLQGRNPEEPRMNWWAPEIRLSPQNGDYVGNYDAQNAIKDIIGAPNGEHMAPALTATTRWPSAFVGGLTSDPKTDITHNLIIEIESYVDNPEKRRRGDPTSMSMHHATSCTLERRSGAIVAIKDNTTRVTKEITIEDFVDIPKVQNMLMGVVGEGNNSQKFKQIIELAMMRFSRTDSAYNYVTLTNSRSKNADEKNSAMAEVLYRKEFCLMAKLLQELYKIGVTVTWLWNGEAALGTMLRGNDLFDFQIPTFMENWTLDDWVNKKMPRGNKNDETVSIGLLFKTPMIIFTPIIDHMAVNEIHNPRVWQDQANFNRLTQVTIIRANITNGRNKHFLELMTPSTRVMSARLADKLAKLANPIMKINGYDWTLRNGVVNWVNNLAGEDVGRNTKADYGLCSMEYIQRHNQAALLINAENITEEWEEEQWEIKMINKMVKGEILSVPFKYVRRNVQKLKLWKINGENSLVMTSTEKMTNFTKDLYHTISTSKNIQTNGLSTRVIFGFKMGKLRPQKINVPGEVRN